MAERERTDSDDIEFDFFDDSPSAEAPTREVAPPRRRRRLPTGPPGGTGAPLARLAVLIGAAILLAVILVLIVRSCREAGKREEYQNYMEQAQSVAGQSERVGQQLAGLLTTPGIKLQDLRGRLNGLLQTQEQLVAEAQGFEPPGQLRQQQESLVEAMQFRVSGLSGLSAAFGQIGDSSNPQAAGRQLTQQAERLTASDVVYADLFAEGSRAVLQNEDVEGVAVPESDFIQSTDFSSPRQWTLIVRRLTQSPEAGGLHGNQIAAVRVQPGDQQLSPTEENTVTASDRLAFLVSVKNSGDSQETQVQVRLTIQQTPTVRKQAVISIINPGETKTVTFSDLGPPDFGTRATLRVTVEPVTGEANLDNNTAEYPVIFTLG
jgi:CARDB protein